jgi:hypothetical protein
LAFASSSCLFLGYALPCRSHILLRQDVVQVVVYADEDEPLFEELTCADGAEKEESEDDFILRA